ncbi:hypothetical protein [[Phormidium ambiguum] IAM M-71]|uniref:hypothetical protein n=1 Tax=[Phormidium ambiguum] IAM M-71 TaxID=454136 RepID=UPI001C4A505B|nr:hypothetical protein [Phormidium ambiguum]
MLTAYQYYFREYQQAGIFYNYQLNCLALPTSKLIMVYRDMPLMIPFLATGYLLAIYLLLIVAQRSRAWRRPQG